MIRALLDILCDSVLVAGCITVVNILDKRIKLEGILEYSAAIIASVAIVRGVMLTGMLIICLIGAILSSII